MRLPIAIAVLVAFAFTASAGATTCPPAVARCKLAGSSKPNIESMCEAEVPPVMKDGNFIGPVTHTPWKNLRKQ